MCLVDWEKENGHATTLNIVKMLKRDVLTYVSVKVTEKVSFI